MASSFPILPELLRNKFLCENSLLSLSLLCGCNVCLMATFAASHSKLVSVRDHRGRRGNERVCHSLQLVASCITTDCSSGFPNEPIVNVFSETNNHM